MDQTDLHICVIHTGLGILVSILCMHIPIHTGLVCLLVFIITDISLYLSYVYRLLQTSSFNGKMNALNEVRGCVRVCVRACNDLVMD